MGYSASKSAKWVLQKPNKSFVLVAMVGLLGGYIAQLALGSSMFGRFGAVSVAFGLLVFGAVASELLVRGQYTFIMDKNGDPGDPFKSEMVRKTLNLQTLAVAIGTLQWGFGDLLFSASCKVAC